MKAVFPFCNIQHAWKTLSTTFYPQMDTFLKKILYIIVKCYVHNIFTMLSQQILVVRLLQVINLNLQLKLFFSH